MNRRSSGLASLRSGISTGLGAYAAGGPVKHFAGGDEVIVTGGRMPFSNAFGLYGLGATGGLGGYSGQPASYFDISGENMFLLPDGSIGTKEEQEKAYADARFEDMLRQGTISPFTITAPDYQSEPGALAQIAAGLGNFSDFMSNPLRTIRDAVTGNLITKEDAQKRIDALQNLLPNERFTYAGENVPRARQPSAGQGNLTNMSTSTFGLGVAATLGGSAYGGIGAGAGYEGSGAVQGAGLGELPTTPKKELDTFVMPARGPYREAPLVQTGTDTSSGMSFQTYAPGALDDYFARLKQFQRGPQTAGIGGVGYQVLPDEETKMAAGGIASLPEYRAGGKLLDGPGDGMSDSIPAVIEGEEPQRAALADGEFVVPADVVSHLGNGSTKAGAETLYGMMDKIRQARTGRKRQAPAIDASDFLPA